MIAITTSNSTRVNPAGGGLRATEILEKGRPVLPKCIERAEQSRAAGSRLFKARIAVDRRGEFFQALAEINRINYINI
jgi:hypothetical protein